MLSFIIILTFCLQNSVFVKTLKSFFQNSPTSFFQNSRTRFFQNSPTSFFQNSPTRFFQNSHFVRASTVTSDMQTQHYFDLYNNTNLISIQTGSLLYNASYLPICMFTTTRETDVAYSKEKPVLLYTNRYYMLRISLV